METILTLTEAASRLAAWDDILVVCHANPDGDALGSMSGLVRGLRALGKRADWHCPDQVPEPFVCLFQGLENSGLVPAHTVTVDVADCKLLGPGEERFAGKVELAIDHHSTHRPFAKERWVSAAAAATAEMVWLLLKELAVSPDAAIASCLYTGMATDTGCFRYRNVTPQTLRLAAEALEAGARAGDINKKLFETKSLAYFRAERQILEDMELFCGGKAAMVLLPQSFYAETGAREDEAEAAVGQLRQIEGVLLGITIKEKPDGGVKGSLRANPPVNAAAVCERLGGGGHAGAAGCTLGGMSIAEAAEKLRTVCEQYFAEIGCI